MFAHVCTHACSTCTHVCVNRTRGVAGYILMFQWYKYVRPTCAHMCALIARVCVPCEHMCVAREHTLACRR